MPKPVPEPTENFTAIRTHFLTQNYRKFNVSPSEKLPNVWAAIMEIGFPKSVVSLICLSNGTVELYFGYGGGITGGGAYESIRMKAEEFILAAETSLRKLSPAKNIPLPDVERVRFYVRTYDGNFTAQGNTHIGDEKDDLFPLFRSGHEVIRALREIEEAAAQNPADEASS
jgi:hypothetical protein